MCLCSGSCFRTSNSVESMQALPGLRILRATVSLVEVFIASFTLADPPLPRVFIMIKSSIRFLFLSIFFYRVNLIFY